jgi:16S rRNA (cytosine1402-N4)-methyltransferase
MHVPVLLHTVLDNLSLVRGLSIVDCNINRAGHSKYIAQALGDTGTIIGIDLDAVALEEARTALAALSEHPRICLIHDNFRNIDICVKDAGLSSVDRILFDLGLSSQELDISGRGFTFQKNEPLHMTYQSKVDDSILTAKDILNLWDEENLADIIYYYSDERYAKRIAKNIVAARKLKKFETTFDLVDVIRLSVPKAYLSGKTHFATKTFQALRIATNDEIGSLKEALDKSWQLLSSGGRIVAITFHSLEDRVVKEFFREKIKTGEGELPHKKPISPTREEIIQNPRSRSAKVRTIIKY